MIINNLQMFILLPFITNSIAGGPGTYLTFCNRYFDIFDSTSRYVISSCYINNNVTWYEAKAICEAHDMFIMTQSNVVVQNSIKQGAKEVFGIHNIKNVWINGNKAITGEWSAYEGSNVYPYIFPGRMGWVNKTAQTLGDCMIMTDSEENFKLSSADCEHKYPYICSFKRLI